MKRVFGILMCLVFLLSLAVPVSAAEPEIFFTDASYYEPGFTMEVDKGETLMSCYNNGTSDIYNAYLEGFVQYYWMRNDSYYADGPSITIRESDRACEFYCVAALYADAEHTQQIGTIYSARFTVPNIIDEPTLPEITTTQLPNAVVGEPYSFKLECTDDDMVYELFRSSLPDGLYLTQHGEIEGTPTKAGFWYVVIMATPATGEEYAATAEFEFYVVEDGPDYTIDILELPKKLTYYKGEKVDMTGMKVRIWTPDGYIDSKDGKYLEYYKGTLDNLGERKIFIKYGDAQEPIFVTVIEAPKPTEPAPTHPYPEILTMELPVAVVGEAYDFTLSSADENAIFSIHVEEGDKSAFYGLGLDFFQNGQMLGVVTGAPGSYQFTVKALGLGGEDTQVFVLNIVAPVEETTVPPTTEAPAESTTPAATEAVPIEPAQPQSKKNDGVTIAAIAGGSAVAVAGIGAYVFLKMKGLIK